MAAYLIDTNHAARIMGSADDLHSLLSLHAHPEDRFFLSITVLCELYFAAYASSRKQQNLQNISALLEHIPVLELDLAVAEEYGRIKAELKAAGRPIPGTDVQIAAVARWHGLTVLSSDRHFEYVDNLETYNWF